MNSKKIVNFAKAAGKIHLNAKLGEIVIEWAIPLGFF